MNSGLRWLRSMPGVAASVLLLLAVALLAAWVQADGSWRGVRWTRPEPIRPELALAGGGAPTAADAGAGDFLALAERPLFAPSRRPAPPEPTLQAAAADVPADALEAVRLYGVFSADGAAGILAQVDGKGRRVTVNQEVAGWTLRSVRNREATFARAGETRVLKLPARARGGAATLPPARLAASTQPPAGALPPAGGPAGAPAVAPRGAVPTVEAREAAARAEDEERLRRVDALLRAAGQPPTRR